MVTRTKKIFVGGLSVNTTVEDVKQYFEQFGKVGLPLWVLGWERSRLGGVSRIILVPVKGEGGPDGPSGEVRPKSPFCSRPICGPQTLDLSRERKPHRRGALITLPLYFSPASLHCPEGGGAPVASSVQPSAPWPLGNLHLSRPQAAAPSWGR